MHRPASLSLSAAVHEIYAMAPRRYGIRVKRTLAARSGGQVLSLKEEQALLGKIEAVVAAAIGGDAISVFASDDYETIRDALNQAAADWHAAKDAPIATDIEEALARIEIAAGTLQNMLAPPADKDPLGHYVAHTMRRHMEADYGPPDALYQSLLQGLALAETAAAHARLKIEREKRRGGRYVEHIAHLMRLLDRDIFEPHGLRRTFSKAKPGSGKRHTSLLADVTWALARLLPREMWPTGWSAVFELHRKLREGGDSKPLRQNPRRSARWR